uniref:Uncharacterized protein n=1 Tax=Romanomermis culicivorax TaxID=13658 RepID=A0A915L3J3_ROMCU
MLSFMTSYSCLLTSIFSRSVTINPLHERLTNVETDLDRLNYIYGPHYIWRIDDFRRRFNDAKAGAKSTIYSPPFLTARHGYKMAVSACLYGDGRGG